jgi:putative nucleotidyltransferase with HDIG domain
MPVWLIVVIAAGAVVAVAVAAALLLRRKSAEIPPAEEEPKITPGGGEQNSAVTTVMIRGEPLIVPLVREALSPDALRQLTELVSKFPPLSPIATQILAELNAREISRERIVQLVSQDPMLTMQLLRLANSAAAAQTREVTSHEQAILLLGYDTVLIVAMRGAVAGLAAKSAGGGFDQQALLRHNVATGLLAGALARRCRLISPSEAVTAGLLHDVGKMVMQDSYPHLVKQLLDSGASRLGESRLGKEERLFGSNHAVQGAVLAARWNLPALLVNAIELHHHPAVCAMDDYPAKDRELTAVVFIANQLSKYVDCSGLDDCEVDLPSPDLLTMLNLPQKYEDILELVRPEIRKQLAIFLEDQPRQN